MPPMALTTKPGPLMPYSVVKVAEFLTKIFTYDFVGLEVMGCKKAVSCLIDCTLLDGNPLFVGKVVLYYHGGNIAVQIIDPFLFSFFKPKGIIIVIGFMPVYVMHHYFNRFVD